MNTLHTNKLIAAFNTMLELIASGVEFPDAQWKVTVQYKLSDAQADRLVSMYDERE